MRAITTIVTFWIPYMAPTIVAWIRRRLGKPIVTTLPMIFTMNLFLGWTVVVWVLMLANAFGLNPVAWFVLNVLGGVAAGRAGGSGSAPRQDTPESPETPVTCSMCRGSGTLPCSICGARGSWYEAPQTATGTAQLRTCTACISSGRLRCTYCGGSGRASF